MACDVDTAESMDIMTCLGPCARYAAWQCCEVHRLCDEKTLGLFKTEWRGDGMVALCSKTYYCQDAEGHDGLSSKGLQKNPIATL